MKMWHIKSNISHSS